MTEMIFESREYKYILTGNNWKIMRETHPKWYHPVRGMRTLILGTFPPHSDRWNFPFYYPNKVNHFWNVLAVISGKPLVNFEGTPAVRERKKIMDQLHVGVQNLGLRIERKGKSALDGDIEIIDYQDILNILNKHDTITNILLPGYSSRTSTYGAFIKYLKMHGMSYTRPESVKAGSRFTIFSRHNPIECTITNSTSPTAQRAGVTLELLVKQFSAVIKYP